MNEQTRTHHARRPLFCADATDAAGLRLQLAGATPDLAIADVPYGQHSAWQGAHAADADRPALWWLLEALRPLLAATTVVAIAVDKAQRLDHAGYRRLERFQLGKRQLALLQPAASAIGSGRDRLCSPVQSLDLHFRTYALG